MTRYFQKVLTLEPARAIRTAPHITADNDFQLWVNGERVAAGSDFHVVETVDLSSALREGDNLLSVSVANIGTKPNPAGLIAVIELRFRDGDRTVLGTDATWRVAQEAADGWRRDVQTGTDWRAARVLGPAAMAPWNLTLPAASDALYPSYESTIALLRQMGITPGFASTGPIRFHFRRTLRLDVFFVANRTAEPVDADCAFRTDGAAPELWDPITGGRRALPRFAVERDTVSVPLRFAGHESYFVVFDRAAPRGGESRSGENFPVLETVAVLDGPYQVTFDPAWGGPEQPVAFETLSPWNTHADPGIRYYSGEATYRKTFACPGGAKPAGRLLIDLGVVHKLARVKLNGGDLGIVWTPPFRLDVTGKLRQAGNELEVTVVNTWVNRLIGDQQPEHKGVRQLQWESGLLGGRPQPAGRYTFTTAQDYNADSPLQESGLFGPVRLMATP